MLCNLCPNSCNVDRNQFVGACGVNDKIKIAKYYLHKFEEPFISGKNGSGTVFFCGCSLRCVFCQNYDLSRNNRGKEISVLELSEIFKELEKMGAENINLVTPTHYVDKIIDAFNIYRPNIPIVYNTHGYENINSLKKIDDYVDVYLPDVKYFAPSVSKRYTGKENYFDYTSKAVDFMMKKPLKISPSGKILSGVVVRHLALPQNISDSKKILDWYSQYKDISYINIMSQYTPFGNVKDFPELNRRLTKREYDSLIEYAISLDINNAFYQKFESQSTEYIPDWDY